MKSNDARPAPVSQDRVRAIDWLRGIAVLFMIQTHTLALLTPELRKTVWVGRLLKVDGLVAPAFIFSAGFATALLMVRSAAGGILRERVGRNLRRIGEVLAVATLVNWAWFPLLKEPVWIFRMDILQCVGACLLIVMPVAALLASRPRALSAVAFVLAMATFAVAPLGELVQGPWATLTNKSNFAPFPLLPWLGFAWLGALSGTVAGAWGRAGLAKALVGLAVLGFAGMMAGDFLYSLYPPHRFFVSNPSNSAVRFAWVCTVLLGLMWLEARVPAGSKPSRLRRFVEVFGTSSLSAYFFHEMLLFYRTFGVFSFQRFWGDKSDWPQFWLLLAALILLTYLLCIVTDRVERVVRPALSRLVDRVARRAPSS
ncbi:heparan-alpha-glucosaminide N-acetyltransferase domain-containing protein [Pyxidicoccus sp. MSG2]|uniref:heparan-alpha-glucosaminide N-acetyltransferase domain-containing protein n=1 Tax=Pyxidicoccus sp. MSG2 TaxID=2996790 RepID=UPI00226D8A9E|nr:heparan-alpha-glucosaminide N-acetyltransferase domain-containing protein [Pyxidicoccus sp. MSG2]MCY1022950.1 heparan-alpha-glucosaminide N-acetyltransferase domain-containing protein [Pyxidicoccus sp. MSG2]